MFRLPCEPEIVHCFMIKYLLLALLIISWNNSSLIGFIPEQRSQNNKTVFQEEKAQNWVEEQMQLLDEEDRIGQLFFVPAYSNLNKRHEKEI